MNKYLLFNKLKNRDGFVCLHPRPHILTHSIIIFSSVPKLVYKNRNKHPYRKVTYQEFKWCGVKNFKNSEVIIIDIVNRKIIHNKKDLYKSLKCYKNNFKDHIIHYVKYK
jgi:hypothetical protein